MADNTVNFVLSDDGDQGRPDSIPQDLGGGQTSPSSGQPTPSGDSPDQANDRSLVDSLKEVSLGNVRTVQQISRTIAGLAGFHNHFLNSIFRMSILFEKIASTARMGDTGAEDAGVQLNPLEALLQSGGAPPSPGSPGGGGLGGGNIPPVPGSLPGGGTIPPGGASLLTAGVLVGVIFAEIGIAFSALKSSVEALDQAFLSAIDTLGNLNPDMAGARAIADINVLMARFQQADTLAPDLVEQIHMRSEIQLSLIEAQTSFLLATAPIMKEILKIGKEGVDLLADVALAFERIRMFVPEAPENLGGFLSRFIGNTDHPAIKGIMGINRYLAVAVKEMSDKARNERKESVSKGFTAWNELMDIGSTSTRPGDHHLASRIRRNILRTKYRDAMDAKDGT